MVITILLALLLGISLGFLLFTVFFLYLLKINCPKCKNLTPLKEIVVFSWKACLITGQACQRCQRPKEQVELYDSTPD